MGLRIEEIRKDFPILKTGIAYLDNAASSLTPEPVLKRMLSFYREYRANVERGVHRLSQRATAEYSAAREELKEFIGARDSREIIFTKNTTEGINLVARGLEWKQGDTIVTTLIEHHSNFIPWLRVSDELGAEVKVVRPNLFGEFSLRDFESAIDERTKLVAIAHVSNVLGCVLPVKEVVKAAHERGAMVLVDGAQSVPHLPLDVKDLGCDFLVFSGHKMLAPTGIGVLYARQECLAELEPLGIGGGTIERVESSGFELAPFPERFEAGTPPIAEAIGLAEAARYLRKQGMKEIAAHEQKLARKMYEGLCEIEGVEVYGPKPPERSGILAFNVGDLSSHDVAATLDNAAKVMVRSGHHCAMPLHEELLKRPKGSVRASVYLYNSAEEVERLVSTVEEISKTLA
jgi:cysteine desulfurase/selenocysteine lyase